LENQGDTRDRRGNVPDIGSARATPDGFLTMQMLGGWTGRGIIFNSHRAIHYLQFKVIHRLMFHQHSRL
jgi:hypothetical protein